MAMLLSAAGVFHRNDQIYDDANYRLGHDSAWPARPSFERAVVDESCGRIADVVYQSFIWGCLMNSDHQC